MSVNRNVTVPLGSPDMAYGYARQHLVSSPPQLITLCRLGACARVWLNQLGASIGALVDGPATLQDGDMSAVKRIVPVVVSAGPLWQTTNLWAYLDRSRDAVKLPAL
jgi:hypothetical protein